MALFFAKSVGSAIYDAMTDTSNDDYILSEAESRQISASDEYAGMTWGEYKAQSPFYNIVSGLNDSIFKEFAITMGAILRGMFQSALDYQNPLDMVKEDISAIFKGAGVGITLTAIGALAWKIAVIWATLAFVVKKFKK